MPTTPSHAHARFARLRRRLVLPLAIACAIGGALAGGSASAFADPAPQRPFAPDSIWNAPLPPQAPLSAASGTYVSELVGQVHHAGAWINSSRWSTPVYRVAGGTPTVSVQIDAGTSMYTNATDPATLATALAQVPIPVDALPSPDSDHHLIVWQPATDTEWELWLARRVAGPGGVQWHAGWGARIDHVSSSSGTAAYPFGATASGLSDLGGLITAGEIASAQIDHAVAIAIPDTEGWGQSVWPANRTDGRAPATTAIPEGTRFRLDPALNVDALGLPRIARAIALAAQRYGIVVRDTGAAVAFYAKQPTDVGLSDYPWGGALDPAHVLSAFPWSHLEAVAAAPTVAGAGTAPRGRATAPARRRRIAHRGSTRRHRAHGGPGARPRP